MTPAISVENLGKCYRVSQGRAGGHDYRTLRESLAALATDPLRRLQGRKVDASGDDFWALKDLSFHVNPGEVVGIIGRNGAGKSTLLKILSRITKPTKGKVAVRGRVGSLLEVGTGFHPELTGRENIYLNGAILGMRRGEIRRQFDSIVEFAEVERFLDTPVKRFSSGMYVRLAFAVAAHLQPEILIIDEVLAVGDAEFQKKCLGKMEEVASAGRTVLFVSHDMTNILRLGTTAVLLDGGQVQVVGDPHRVVETYLAKSRQAHDTVVPLGKASRPREGCGRAEIICAAWVAPTASPWSLPFGQDLEFSVTVRADSRIPALDLGPSIFTATGVEIASSLSSHVMDRREWRAGTYVFNVRYLDLRLLPGRYNVNIGLRTGYGLEDYVRDALQFEVTASELAARMHTSSLRGVVVPFVDYRVEPIDRARLAG